MDPVIGLLAGNGVLLAVLSYLAKEIRKDTRDTRDKVLILWDHHQRAVRHSDVHREIA